MRIIHGHQERLSAIDALEPARHRGTSTDAARNRRQIESIAQPRAGRRQNIQHVHATDQRRFHGLACAFIYQIEVQPVESRADVLGP